MKDGENNKPSDPVSTWDTKQLKSAINLNTSDWTTTVTLELPTVSKTEQQPDPIAVKSGSYVIDQIGNEFTFKNGLSLEVNGKEISVTQDETNKNLYHFRTETGGTDLYTVTYTDKNDETKTPAQFKWEINQDIPAGTKVTLSYKLKLTNPKTGTYGTAMERWTIRALLLTRPKHCIPIRALNFTRMIRQSWLTSLCPLFPTRSAAATPVVTAVALGLR